VKRLALLLACLGLGALTPAAGALDIHAHRGGTLSFGKPARFENSMQAFKSARFRHADVVELDVHVSKDGVPFVMHDGTLDRTTDCTGPVADHTAAELDKCHIVILGTNDVFKRVPASTERVPRLAAVLSYAKSKGVRLNVEINHYPNEPSFDPTDRFVTAELDTIDASKIPKKQILIQSFLPDNLTPAKQRGYRTALITFGGAQGQAIQLAQQGGFDAVEPQWPIQNAAAFVKQAHDAGKQVIPFTLDKPKDVVAARAAHVDGIITDDPPLAVHALQCDDADRVYRAALKRYKAAQKALKRARKPKDKKRARARVKAEGKKLAKAKRARAKACA
jgi:glycerophosphoryl diester phosphodiesterase